MALTKLLRMTGRIGLRDPSYRTENFVPDPFAVALSQEFEEKGFIDEEQMAKVDAEFDRWKMDSVGS